MANKDNISAPVSGMVMDIPSTSLKENQYTYALNAAIEANSQEGFTGVLQNDGSNVLAVNFPQGYKVIGKVFIHEQNRTIFALLDGQGNSQIGEIIDCVYDDNKDDIAAFSIGCKDCLFPTETERKPLEEIDQTPYCTFHTIVTSECLNFSIDFPVRIRYKITDCGLNIYFTDNNNQRRFLYFDYSDPANSRSQLAINKNFKVVTGVSPDACEEPIYSDELDCNKINYHPSFEIPCIKSLDVVTGGLLKAGVIQALIAYSDADGHPMTEYFPATNPVPIFSKYITFETNYETDKAVKITIDNLDQTFLYGYYNIVIAETIDNFTEFKLIGTFPITQSTVTYTGAELNFKKLTADDIFFRKSYYEKAGNITDANRFLFFSNLTEFSKPNLQRVANGIKLYWQTVAIPEAVYYDPHNTFQFRALQRDEVYPFGVEFIADEGEVLGTYHIPGPSKDLFPTADDIISNNDVLTDSSCNGLTRNKRWQVYNIATVLGSPHETTLSCDDEKVWEYGEFSYWESIRTYPNIREIWGDLCGEPIRFHKTPDSLVTHIHDSKNGSKGFSDKNIVFPLGVRVDHQSVIIALDQAVTDGIITQADRDRIKEYRIVRGNRVGNKSIVAKGLIYDMWHYDKNDKRYFYPNYPYNDLRDDDFISNDPTTYQGGNNSNPIPNVFDPTGRYTFHSPDVHFVNPTIGSEIKIETLEYGESEGYFNLCELQAKQKFLSTASMTLAFAAGVAIAFSVEKEREEKVVVTQSKQNVSGTVPGAIITLPGVPPINYTPVLPPQSLLYDDFTGQPIGLGGTDPIDPLVVTEVQRRTVRGKPFQLLSPLSGNPVGLFLQQSFYLLLMGLKEMNIIIDLIRSLIPMKNLSIQYNSIGKYVNYQDVANAGSKIRELERSAYLEPSVQLVDEAIDASATQFTNIYINNWNRERSVYLKIDEATQFPSPAVEDTSRFTMDAFGLDQDDLNKRVNAPVSSYYASIKNFIPDQYGDINSIQYLPTGGCSFKLSEDYTIAQTMVFGGDTFITRFALKRKMPFFLQTRFKFNDMADSKYSELGNVGFPNYYFNTEEPLMERLSGGTVSDNIFDLIVDLLGIAQTRLDAKTQKAFYQSGFIHLYNYGIPYFFAESDVNVDYRHGENNLEKDFYPHQQDLDFWLQEKNVPITEDNFYFYNKTYSKQNKEAFILPQVKQVIEDCKVNHPSLLIASIEQVTNNSSSSDNWLIFPGNDIIDFPASNGRIIGIDGIENDKILVRFENGSQILAAYDTLKSDAGNIQIGKGTIFGSRPREFSTAKLGFAGTQHTDILQTEFGHIWVDAKRGQVFNLQPGGAGLDELAKEGMRNWFKENLPFQILKDFNNFALEDIDNNFKGIGLHLSFDKRFNRFFITKLDYRKIKAVTYNAESKKFFDGTDEILLTNTDYFCNKSWTISYNFNTKTWVSYHSFKPNFYIDNVDYIQSGLNDDLSTLWSHNVTNKSYQVYYGTLSPFTVETTSVPMMLNGVLNSVSYMQDAIRYHNNYDTAYNRKITFNKALIFNELQSSGPLELHVKNENDFAGSIQYPKVENNKINILVTNRDNIWNFNQFHDVVNLQTGNIPFILNNCNNCEKVLNTDAFNYFKPDVQKQKIRGRQTKLQLTNDKYSNFKFVYYLSNQEKGTF
jgi:hypothetical protein